MARTQKNKATNAHLGLLKAGCKCFFGRWHACLKQRELHVAEAKLAKLRAQIVTEGTKGSGGGGGQQGFEACNELLRL